MDTSRVSPDFRCRNCGNTGLSWPPFSSGEHYCPCLFGQALRRAHEQQHAGQAERLSDELIAAVSSATPAPAETTSTTTTTTQTQTQTQTPKLPLSYDLARIQLTLLDATFAERPAALAALDLDAAETHAALRYALDKIEQYERLSELLDTLSAQINAARDETTDA